MQRCHRSCQVPIQPSDMIGNHVFTSGQGNTCGGFIVVSSPASARVGRMSHKSIRSPHYKCCPLVNCHTCRLRAPGVVLARLIVREFCCKMKPEEW